jgi:glucosamine-6-phosphate deaminase
MQILRVKNYKELSEKSSEILINQISKKTNSIIGLATGKTPLGMYRNLVNKYKKGEINLSKIKIFNLDEFYPIKNNKKSYSSYLYKNFFNKTNIKKRNIILLNGKTKDPSKECLSYEKKIRKNKVDLMILGVGENGHIAFNEPGSLKNTKTRLVDLKHKAVGKKALTIGISTIMNSKKILLLAFGKKKAKAIKKLVKGKPNKNCPVSFLKKHKNLIVIIDKKAGSLL